MNRLLILFATAALLAGCQKHAPDGGSPDHAQDATAVEASAKGPHGGRMLSDGPFALELAIFEAGVPPEYHAWPALNGNAVPLDTVELSVALTRLDGTVDRFAFTPQGDYLRGDGVIHEPHSFAVEVTARHAGATHTFRYDSFEGRTMIAAALAAEAGIATETAGSATLLDTITLYGRIAPDPNRQRELRARFPGMIRKVSVSVGDRVRAGATLAVIESDDSLASYEVLAPIDGQVIRRDANPGEHSGDRVLFTILDAAAVVAELSVFPRDRARLQPGAQAQVRAGDGDAGVTSAIERFDAHAGANQAVLARVPLANAEGLFVPGQFVTAEVVAGQRPVLLAVKTSALQPFRDFTVVFEQIGDTYEVRMLELGERHGVWVEVLGGLRPGARYVTENSFLIKADIEKSGASHDH